MILWTFKLFSSVRKAIAGRRYPAQMAWAVAFGLLLGLIPHGNFVTVVLVLLVLSLKLNHAMAALVTIGVTFIASNLDPVFHNLGSQVLSHPVIAQRMIQAWDLPMVPWTDLNNTVVMGSLLIGLVALVPTFALSYPVFKHWSLGLAMDDETDVALPPARRRSTRQRLTSAKVETPQTVAAPIQMSPPDFRRVDQPQTPLPTPHVSAAAANPVAAAPATTKVAIRSRVDEAQTTSRSTPARVVPPVAASAPSVGRRSVPMTTADSKPGDDQQKIDEALRYLLRQLRDSQEKDAA